MPDNPGSGAITGAISYTWQVERGPGSGVFEDIIDLPAGDLAFQSANGTTFRVTPDLAGLSLRVKAIYQDAHGVPETVFSAPTAPVIDVPDAPPAPPPAAGPTDHRRRSRHPPHPLRPRFHSQPDQDRRSAMRPARTCSRCVPNIRAAVGLRTVDGSFNNLINFGGIDQTEFGAADNVFPRLTDPVFRDAEARRRILRSRQPAARHRPTTQTSGNVFDSQPRTISNLIVDQTANNPAAYADRLRRRRGWRPAHAPTMS